MSFLALCGNFITRAQWIVFARSDRRRIVLRLWSVWFGFGVLFCAWHWGELGKLLHELAKNSFFLWTENYFEVPTCVIFTFGFWPKTYAKTLDKQI